jgi:hypothetical protein
MKKTIFVLTALCLMALPFAANAGSWFGVKGGINMADLSGDVEDTEMRNGFSGGAFYGWGINEQFGIQIEGLYMAKGAKGQTDEGGHLHDAEYKLAYIEFPILFGVNLPAGEALSFGIFAGPTVGFNVKSEIEIEDHGTEDLSDQTESFEFGATIGGGLCYKLEKMMITADVRYGIGATSILKEIEGVSFDVKNRGIGIMAGLAFPLGGK